MIKKYNRIIGISEMVLAMSFGGSSVVAGKFLSGNYSVFLIGFMSLLFSLVFMIPVQLFKVRELLSLRMCDLKYMIFQALFGIVFFRLFTLLGLKFTTALSAGILTSTTPAVIAVAAVILLGEKFRGKDVAAIILAVLGILVINIFSGQNSGGFSFSAEAIVGNLFILMAVAGEALLTIFRKKTVREVSSVTNTTVLSVISLLLFLPFAVPDILKLELSSVTTWDLIIIIYYGCFVTAAGYMLWGDGAFRIPAKQTGIISSCMPLAAILLSTTVLNEVLEWYHITGGGLIFISLLTGCIAKEEVESNV